MRTESMNEKDSGLSSCGYLTFMKATGDVMDG